jgi:hypothetical protein
MMKPADLIRDIFRTIFWTVIVLALAATAVYLIMRFDYLVPID